MLMPQLNQLGRFSRFSGLIHEMIVVSLLTFPRLSQTSWTWSTFLLRTLSNPAALNPLWRHYLCNRIMRLKRFTFHRVPIPSLNRLVQTRNRCALIIQRDRERFIRYKAERLTSSITGRRTFWSLTKTTYWNIFSSNFPPICNFSMWSCLQTTRDPRFMLLRIFPLTLYALILLFRRILFPITTLLHLLLISETSTKR